MEKFILLAVMSLLLIYQDFPQKEIVDASFKMAAKYNEAVREGRKLASETIVYLKKCPKAK